MPASKESHPATKLVVAYTILLVLEVVLLMLYETTSTKTLFDGFREIFIIMLLPAVLIAMYYAIKIPFKKSMR